MKFYLIPVLMLFLSCSKDIQHRRVVLFTDITQDAGINFSNDVSYTKELNPYTYRNFYNGAGVAVGDINNDGLPDLYFASNQSGNKLYLNKGGLSFEDITDKAGVSCKGVWSTGVTFADVNSDGNLDLYVCKSGAPGGDNRNNELFINNGDLTFTEKSQEFGLDITGLSVQAAFFDYDKDGDLDCYLLTNSFKSVGNFDLVPDQRMIPDPLGAGNKFFVNENNRFIDRSAEANIYRSTIGFGLGITLGDFNDDTWTDIFVSNDFFERDYLYINNTKGGFTESLTDYFQSISMGSMGADLADLDNDGQPELFVTEMLPDSLSRKKSKTVYENWNKYQLNVSQGYHHQFSRNVLQKKTSANRYVEIGRLAGVESTEWSWGALLFDMDNDGFRDIFVANGIYRDLLDRDYLTYSGNEDNVRKMIREHKEDAITKLIELMPSSASPDYAFRNKGDLQFENVASEWGLGHSTYSSGSAYGDFDLDGDLDLVVNNLNAPAVFYRNNTDSSTFRNITFILSDCSKNTGAVGASVVVYCGDKKHFADNFVTRGFQSSVQSAISIGLGAGVNAIDSAVIQWPDRGFSIIRNIAVNSRVNVNKCETPVIEVIPASDRAHGPKLELVSNSLFEHRSSGLVDFNRERLLPAMYSNETPFLIKGNVDKDADDEIYVGGGKDQPGVMLQFSAHTITSTVIPALEKFAISEKTNGTFVDVDNDNDLDLYLAMGGRFFPKTSSALEDKLLINDGNGRFADSPHTLPFKQPISTSVAKAIDFDRDGDSDLVIGERFDPFVYGVGGRAYLFENDGHGKFNDVTAQRASVLMNVGMITDIEVQDIDLNGWNDLVLVGDWTPIHMIKNFNGTFTSASEEFGTLKSEGWWHAIESSDLNKDGKADFVVGNHGLNSFFRSNDRMYINDFDGDGSIEQIFCTKIGDRYYPLIDKDDLLSQIPSLKKQLLYYANYAGKSIDQIFPEKTLDASRIVEVNMLSSVLLLSGQNGFTIVDLPQEAQYSSIYDLLIGDIDNDGVDDLIAGGNNYKVKPQFGRSDASHGWFFKGELKGKEFSFQKGFDLGIDGEIRDIEIIDRDGTKYIFFTKHNDKLEIYKISN
jgi:hypothetical protein